MEQLTQKFKEDNHVDFIQLDIPVNAAATALKDHLKQLPPLLPQNKMEELTTIAGKYWKMIPLGWVQIETNILLVLGIGDRSCRLLKLKEMLMSLPRVNFEVLKFLFQHFVRYETKIVLFW